MRRSRHATGIATGCFFALILAAFARHVYGGRADGWWEEDVGTFTMLLPPDMRGESGWGEDSFGGQYSSPTMQLHFDTGMWSASLSGGGTDWPKTGTIENTTIQGRSVQIGWATSPSGPFRYQIRAYFPRNAR